jgi:hypothetical protein
MKNDPNYFIYNYLYEIKNQCDIKRENLKLKIDNHFDNILNEIENFQMECEKLARRINNITILLEGYKSNLNDWVESFNTINLLEDLKDETIFRAKLTKLKLDIELTSLKQQLLQNKTVKFDSEYHLDPIYFGILKFEEVNHV